MLLAFTPRSDGAGNATTADPATVTAPVGRNTHPPLMELTKRPPKAPSQFLFEGSSQVPVAGKLIMSSSLNTAPFVEG